jgi:ketosteroid isomerase-like protein
MRSLLVASAALLLGGCFHRGSVATPSVPPRGPTRDSLIQLDLTRGDTVAARGPVAGVVSLLRPDVVYLRAGVPAVYGREGTRALLAAGPEPGAVLWQPLGGGISRDGRSGYTYGVTTRGVVGRTGLRIERYIAYWQRDAGAPWRIAAYAEIGGPMAVEVALRSQDTIPPAPRLTPRQSNLVARLHSTDSLFSDLADRMGLTEGFSSYVADDGVLFTGSELVIGPHMVHDYFEASRAGTSLTWRPMYASAAASEDLGFTVGTYVAIARGPSGAAVQRFGKYLTVWKRQRDDIWRFVVDGGNGDRR